MTKLPTSKARAVGVSNHTIPHLEALINGTGVVPAANQIERHPVLQSNDLIEYCQKKGIHVTAYSVCYKPSILGIEIIEILIEMYNQAFGNNMLNIPLLITRPEVKEVAEAVAKRTGQDVTPAHVILAWSQVGGHSVIPKSVTPSRIRDNFKEVELTAEEVAKVSALGNDRKRYNTPYTASMCSFIYVSQSIFVDELLTGLPYRQASLEH
jgi:L-glyceraldehyde reductase